METVFSRLSDTALQFASSPKIFARGETYAFSGAVTITGEDAAGPRPTVHARVAGTENYSVSVWITEGGVDGSCDCPNAGDGWFCKHQVAVALVWRHRLSGAELVLDEAARRKVQASTKRAQTVRDQREALHEFLHSLPAPTLAEKLIELADAYREIDRELQQWQRLSHAQDRPESLKALVTDILAAKESFLPLRETWSYLRRAEAVLPLLQKARERDAQSAVPLALHALRRSWAVLMKADDSDGEIGGLAKAIAAEWVAALQAAGAQPPAFGEAYLRVQLEDPFGCFDEEAVEAAIGNVALERYRALLEKQWRQTKDAVLARRSERAAKPAHKRSAADWLHKDEAEIELRRLERLHLAQLERMGDVDGALAVLRSDLSEPYRLGVITEFLEQHGRPREALANAERAYKAFPDDRRLQDDLLRCYERDGWVEEAYALRRAQFDAAPSVERYHQALKAGIAAHKSEPALRQDLLNQLESLELEKTKPPRTAMSSRLSKQPPASAAPVRNVSLRAQVLCSERRWTEALDLVQPPSVCHPEVLRNLALQLGTTQSEQSVALLLRVFEHAMRTATTPYRDELELVGEIAEQLDAERRAAWLANLRLAYKAKRNFVRELPKS